MDIYALSTTMSTMNLQADVSMAVLNQSLDTAEVLGDNMIKMMEQSVAPNLGQNIDISL